MSRSVSYIAALTGRTWVPTLPLLYCLLSAFNPALAAEPLPTDVPELSLATCLERAEVYHPLLEAKAHETAAAEAQRDSVWSRRLPTVRALAATGAVPDARGNAISATPSSTDFIQQLKNLGPFFRFETTLIQPIYTFGKLSKGEEAAKAYVRVKASEHEELRWKTRTEVKQLYYGWLLLLETQDLLAELHERAQQARDYVERRLEEEDPGVSPTDRLKIQTFEAELESRDIEVSQRLQVIQDALARMLGLHSNEEWRLNTTTLSVARAVPDGTLNAALERTIQDHPEVRRLAAAVDALRGQMGLSRAQFYPDLFVGGRFRYGFAPNRERQQSPFANDEFNFFDAGAMLGLRFSWDIGVTRHQLREMKAKVAAMEANKRAVEAHLRHKLARSRGAFAAQRQQLSVRRRGFKAGRAWSVAALNALNIGTGSAESAITALKAYVAARFTRLEGLYGHNVALAELSQACAQELQADLVVSNTSPVEKTE